MAFTTNMTGTTQLDNSIVEDFEAQFLLASAQEQIMDQFVSYKADIGAASIAISKYAQLSLATTPLTEDEDATSSAMSDSDVIITPKEYGGVVTTTRLASLKSGGKADLAAARVVGINMGRTQDKLAVLAAEAGANKLYVGQTAEANVTASDIMSPAELNKLYNKLARASVIPLVDGTYVAVLHDDVIYDLRNGTGAGSWQDINKYANPETVLKNEVGMLCGFRIVRNNHITINADAGALAVDTYYSLCMGANALGKAVSQAPQLKITGPFDKLARFVNIGWHGVFEYKIVDSDALWLGVSASSIGANS